jgi:hypothetical protein
VRGKYYRAYQQGHAVRITKADGAIDIQYFTLQEGAVLLEPDVREVFPRLRIGQSCPTRPDRLDSIQPSASQSQLIGILAAQRNHLPHP